MIFKNMENTNSAFLWKCILIAIATFEYNMASKWYRHPSLDNKVSQSGYGLPARSLTHCANACASDVSCMSFFFITGQVENCKIQSEILTKCSPGLIDVPGSAYYVMEYYPPFSCPPDNTVFRTVRLSDNNHLTYRVSMTIKKNQTDAKASCESEGGFLIRVTTLAKMNTLLTLTSCPAYSTTDFYVDGSNANSGPTWDTWITANNEILPMSNDFWRIGAPSNPDIEHCVRMKSGSGHMWSNNACSSIYYFICEKC